MAYACPVCEEPQADGEHLANHLAFSALLGRSEHADWLDEHAPDWGDDDPESLAERVTPHAETVEGLDLESSEEDLPNQPQVNPQSGLEGALARQGGQGREPLDPETKQVVEEAREMTRERRESTTDSDEGSSDGKE